MYFAHSINYFSSLALSISFSLLPTFFILFLTLLNIQSIISMLLFYLSFHFFFIFFSPVASLFVESKVVVAFTSSFAVKLDSIVVEVKVDSIVFVVKFDSRGLVVKFASIVFIVEVKSDSVVFVDVVVVVKTGKVSFSVLFLAQWCPCIIMPINIRQEIKLDVAILWQLSKSHKAKIGNSICDCLNRF